MSAHQLILAAMEREGITWDQVEERLVRDEKISVVAAKHMVAEADADSGVFSLLVAAAIITLIADKSRRLS